MKALYGHENPPSAQDHGLVFCREDGAALDRNVTETVYRHEIRPALTTGAAAMDKIFEKAPDSA